METYDYYYREDTRILRVVKKGDIYEAFYMDNDGTEVVNWAETFYTLSSLLAEINRLERAE